MGTFEAMTADKNISVIFAETTTEQSEALGMLAVNWSSETESYWGNLRVSASARGNGIARLLFGLAARLAVQRQGEDSVSRWGVVSANTVMVNWSTKLQLSGPQK